MKLRVFAIAMATFGDVFRLISQRPIAVVLAMACTIPLEYGLAAIEVAGAEWQASAAFAASAALSIVVMIIWLPFWIAAIRQIISGTEAGPAIGSPSRTSLIYAACNVAFLFAALLISSSRSTSVTVLVVQIAAAALLIWLVVRTTLFLTALALGRLDLGVRDLVARTSGHVLRLLAIIGLILLAWVVVAFATAFALAAALAETDIDAQLHAGALIGVLAQFASLSIAIAGAHIYRAIGPAAAQNGRY